MSSPPSWPPTDAPTPSAGSGDPEQGEPPMVWQSVTSDFAAAWCARQAFVVPPP